MTDEVSSGLPRDLLAKYFGDDPRLVAAFEDQSVAVQANSAAVEETAALKDASVIVLAANGEFTNERLLQWEEGIEVVVSDTAVTFRVKDVARTQDFGAIFVPPADVTLFLPPEGTLVSAESPALLENKIIDTPRLATVPNFANDAAAAAGGVEVGQVYRNGSILMVRVA